MADACPVVLEGTTPIARPLSEPRTKGAAAPPPTRAPSAPVTTARVDGEADGTLANSSGRPARLGPARQWGHTATHSPTNTPENARRTTARTCPAPPRRAREPIASSRRPAPCQLLPGAPRSPLPRGCQAERKRRPGWRPPLRRRCAPPTAVGHIEAGGGGRSSVASSPLPRWRLVPVSPQFLPYELGFLALIREEQVMRCFALWETRVGGRLFLRRNEVSPDTESRSGAGRWQRECGAVKGRGPFASALSSRKMAAAPSSERRAGMDRSL